MCECLMHNRVCYFLLCNCRYVKKELSFKQLLRGDLNPSGILIYLHGTLVLWFDFLFLHIILVKYLKFCYEIRQ